MPAWYQDAKFGIFIHWGVYSVPAFGSEWYPRQMYQQGSKEFAHHVQTRGPQIQFGYKDFIPLFKAEKYDPRAWAALFKEAGAKFVVPVAEHHDGFAMYDSALTTWDAKDMGPRRDLVGDLAEAVRREGLVFGLSTHRAEHWWFFDGGRTFDSDVRDPQYAGLYGPAQPRNKDRTLEMSAAEGPDKAYLDDWLARTRELVDKYRPQLVWFDWWIGNEKFEPYLREFAAGYYDRGLEWKRGVAINYKLKAFPEGTAVLDIERGQLAGIREQFWQTDTAVSKNSWGYVEGQDYKTVDSLVDDLVDIVSKNGALLLNIGPRPDGTIPEPEQRMLRDMGRWLNVNGDAIYADLRRGSHGGGGGGVQRHQAPGLHGPGPALHHARPGPLCDRAGLARPRAADQIARGLRRGGAKGDQERGASGPPGEPPVVTDAGRIGHPAAEGGRERSRVCFLHPHVRSP